MNLSFLLNIEVAVGVYVTITLSIFAKKSLNTKELVYYRPSYQFISFLSIYRSVRPYCIQTYTSIVYILVYFSMIEVSRS